MQNGFLLVERVKIEDNKPTSFFDIPDEQKKKMKFEDLGMFSIVGCSEESIFRHLNKSRTKLILQELSLQKWNLVKLIKYEQSVQDEYFIIHESKVIATVDVEVK